MPKTMRMPDPRPIGSQELQPLMPMTRKMPNTAATDAKDDEDARPATNREARNCNH